MKALVIYYSHSGNTRRLGEEIAQQAASGVLELVPEIEYPQNYDTVVAQAKRELQNSFRPALKTEIPDLSPYDMIFVGTPNWWSSPAPPVLTFLELADLDDVQIAPFCTHGGAAQATSAGIWKNPAVARRFYPNCPFTAALPELPTSRSG